MNAGIDRLARFVEAQADCYTQALRELRAGQKLTHWMWFVFPQFAGLGLSPMAQRYAIDSMAEAQAYLRHPLLGARLLECTQAVNAVEGRSARQIFGTPDDLKFCSSMTLFEAANVAEGSAFALALEKYYLGRRDEQTLDLIRAA
jgi:uncharacterized protein (DUF1810 family)